MKTLETRKSEFNAAGLLPLNAEEERNVCGGFWLQLLGGGLVAARAIWQPHPQNDFSGANDGAAHGAVEPG